VQVDFILPARFELKYRAADGHDRCPVMIHRALAGSLERFFGVLLEHYGGAFPAWLAPIQVVVAPISENQLSYARGVADRLEGAGFRVEVDESSEKLGYKIRHWKTQKVPYILVTGKQELADGTVNVNQRGVDEKRTLTIESFVDELHRTVEAKA
jgi:threonyl-tRNA synthetase